MNENLKIFFSFARKKLIKIYGSLAVFFSVKRNRRLSYLVAIGLFALGEFWFSGLVRRTFVFYSIIEGNTVVEDRLIHRSSNRETDIRRYVEEALLGPVSPDSAPLFSRETRLYSFMYRQGIVYADLTESAVLPVPEANLVRPFAGVQSRRYVPEDGDVFRSLLTLNEGIRRNFSFVKDVRLFIGGNEVFFEEFRGIFANSADNSKTAP